jgi:hypothetical protein
MVCARVSCPYGQQDRKALSDGMMLVDRIGGVGIITLNRPRVAL